MIKRHSFEIYFYFENLMWCLAAALPPALRTACFRLSFRRFGKGSYIDYGVYVRYPWKVSIGCGTVLNRGCRIYPSYAIKSAQIIIGDHVAVGPDVVFCGAGHDYSALDLADVADTITIDDHVWIGARSVLLPGVRVGKGAVIGAGSVVTRDVPAWSVAVGNPAKVINNRTVDVDREISSP
jgi:acetyltransferase-like isoleucine patch superfamily enzyme